MITIPAGARILLATRPIDLGKGAHGLAALAQEVLAEDPFSGAAIVYPNFNTKIYIYVSFQSFGHRTMFLSTTSLSLVRKTI